MPHGLNRGKETYILQLGGPLNCGLTVKRSSFVKTEKNADQYSGS